MISVNEITNYENDAKFEVSGYYDSSYNGLDEYCYVDSFEELVDVVWQFVNNGDYVEVTNHATGNVERISPDIIDDITDYDYDVSEYLHDILSEIDDAVLNESITYRKHLNELYNNGIKRLNKNPRTKTLEQVMRECGN